MVRDLLYEPSRTTLEGELENIRDNLSRDDLSRDTPLSCPVDILREELWELEPFKTVWDQYFKSVCPTNCMGPVNRTPREQSSDSREHSKNVGKKMSGVLSDIEKSRVHQVSPILIRTLLLQQIQHPLGHMQGDPAASLPLPTKRRISWKTSRALVDSRKGCHPYP